MLQVYTGTGKGKTTAAIGISMRAIGAGMRVYIMQFMKGLAYSEQQVLWDFFPRLVLKTTGKPFFIAAEGMLTPEEREAWGNDVVVFPPGKPPADYVKMIEDGFDEAAEEACSGKYGLVVLDEINVALFFGLIGRERVEKFLDNVPEGTELIFTGRNAPDWLTERADLVTEMKEIKHYYQKGIEARKGIEN
ncbi:MAG: cob(I)yrinic acid a,c-diamide adenosyltransferase [Schwartzia sp.]|nr:cob(I)yrinic acid a,c-diamide adenosyltransferase [Schwartzia sp. (in: firmicutes)]